MSDPEALHNAPQVADIGIANHPTLEMSLKYAVAETMYVRDEGARIVTDLSHIEQYGPPTTAIRARFAGRCAIEGGKMWRRQHAAVQSGFRPTRRPSLWLIPKPVLLEAVLVH